MRPRGGVFVEGNHPQSFADGLAFNLVDSLKLGTNSSSPASWGFRIIAEAWFLHSLRQIRGRILLELSNEAT